MKVIGITGGVGAGKSTVLDIIRKNCSCFILIADEAAHEVERKGQTCYYELVRLLGEDILAPDGQIDKKKMAERIFDGNNRELLSNVNRIVHPRVKEYILGLVDEHSRTNDVDYFFIEAALLIEDGYKAICDELWYVYASQEIRSDRLKRFRGYSDKKIEEIMGSQSDEETFRKYCDHVIENNGDIEMTEGQIIELLR
ncbi:MAG: dephospho-CoA kinase [Lachnospiraceae bacterium]|nr:dephospho-CoA kinase [Lachnospiraceae bacterium]